MFFFKNYARCFRLKPSINYYRYKKKVPGYSYYTAAINKSKTQLRSFVVYYTYHNLDEKQA